ncbi:MAG: M3 family oligoendopeptidase [Fimbriimonadaceae bacterium]|nr:M3 family oligoendopeptidase [Fimbriimonadaceae bacterium]
MSSSAAGISWDLTSLFSGLDDPKIEATWEEVDRLITAFEADYRGKVGSGSLTAAELERAIRRYEEIGIVGYKPASFASLVYAADTSKPEHGAFYQAQMERGSESRVRMMFFELELQEASQEWIDAMMAAEELADCRHFLSVVRVASPYRLSEEKEVLLEEVSNTGARAWVRLHEDLTSNHVFRFTHPETGEVEELTESEVLHRLRHEDRAIRQAAGDSLSAGLKELERTIVFTYNTLMADKKLEDRLRGYDSPEQSRHQANELEAETVQTVLDLCRERSDLVARYYRVKREILGLDELTHIDRYAPLFDAKTKVGWEEAREMVLKSFGSFSPTLADRADEFFQKSWIDAAPRAGKRGGAFCSYITPDLHPVVLMTYQDSIEDVMTLAHELGHGVHASLSRKQSLINYHGTLPLAELASIFGEMLVFERVVGDLPLRDQVALYAQKIEGIFASVHRQAAMCRFEMRCHRLRREEGEISAETFGELWQEELQSMFEDSVALGDQHRMWWTYVGHFFFAPFYVYAYAFGELLTLAIYQKAKAAGPDFADRYVDVLERGGGETPHELMARLGVDLRDPEFWKGGFRVIEDFVSTFETKWAELQKQS